MKKIKLLSFALIAVLGLSISSCSSDDDNGGTASEFNYQGTSYSLSSGILESYGGTNPYNFDITLLSSGLMINSTGDIEGTGDLIYLEMWSDDQTTLKEGTYTYSSQSAADLTFTNATAAINCSAQTQNCETTLDLVGGSVELSRNGQTWVLDFNLSTATGETVSGQYSGAISAQ